ncbi:sialic acid-binding Ig-like lectin 16 [Rhinichthys klamathensis goyatoka]|uniref:sialic acid-binding Ig-like lectin 16 n=1 Tax=Rhinichthys klamathensis goyatoka TaxID=3034132 RepID=UPI0024B57B0E|nr:sialic acid-binding Ig-like lectin 16 [Rhinichthys klamathensis goyatoka]
MQISSSCTILSMLVLNILCTGHGNEDWSITFNPPEMIAVPGLCALISCTFTYPNEAKPIDTVQWRVCHKNSQCKIVISSIFKGKVNTQKKKTHTDRIKMLEPDLTKNNCSIIMKDIQAEDENEYAFRVEGQLSHKMTYKSTVKIIIQDEPIMNIPPLSEGVKASLTCSAPFPCPETPPEITWWIKTGENITNLENDNITLIPSRSLYLSTLPLTPTSKMHNATVGCDVSYGNKTISTSRTLEVMYVQTLQILGDDKVMEGDTLRLNCTVESHPPSSDPVWSFNETADNIRNHTSAENLMITNVRKEHAGIYVCEMTYMKETLNASITINVIHVQTLQILGDDKVMEGDTLRLNCTVESHPPSSDPVWSFNETADNIRNHTSAENLMITNVRKEHAGIYVCEMTYMKETLNASITINVIRDTHKLKINESFTPGVENLLGKDDLVNSTEKPTGIEGLLKKLDISTIVTFVAGMACSAIIFSMILCCWVSCHRGKRHKVLTENPDTDINLETVQTDVAQSGTNEQTPLHGQLDGGTTDTAAPTDGAQDGEAVEMQAGEVDYASIDYSLLKNRPPEEGEMEPTDTDYAEIKRDKIGDGKQREALQDGDDQIETPNQKWMEGEEELYSNSQMLKS